MIYAIVFVFYWLVTGLALFMIPTQKTKHDFKEFIACLVLGGIVVPAGLLLRLIT